MPAITADASGSLSLVDDIYATAPPGRLATRVWTAFVVGLVVVDIHSIVTDTESVCTAARKGSIYYPIYPLIFVLLNGTLGMGFVHKLALAVLLLFDCLTPVLASCGELVVAVGSAVAVAVCVVVAHLYELRARREFAEDLTAIYNELRMAELCMRRTEKRRKGSKRRDK